MVEILGMGACIEAFEYTVGRFADFLNEHGNTCAKDSGTEPCYTEPTYWREILYHDGEAWVAAPGKESHAMAWVSWWASREACEREGKRLCRLDEWIAACRGPEEWEYPYGDELDTTRCNTCTPQEDCWFDADVAPVGSFPECEGGYTGLFDMNGNVSEWVEDSFTSFRGPGCRHDMGGYFLGAGDENVQYRCTYAYVGPTPSMLGYGGFRCCLTLE